MILFDLKSTYVILIGVAVAFILLFSAIQLIDLKNDKKVARKKEVKEEKVQEEQSQNEELDIEKIIYESTGAPETPDESSESSKEEIVDLKDNDEVTQNKRKGKYEIYKVGDNYLYRLKASNGEILCDSEFYPTEQSAIEAIEIVKKNVDNGIYQIVEEKNEMFIYKLSSRNHRTLITSPYYTTKKGAEDASEAFKRNALTDITVILNEVAKDDQGCMEVFNDNTQGNDEFGTYEVLPSGKKFYFVLKAQNGTVICHSQDYVSKTSCITGLEQFRTVVYEGTFYIARTKNDKYQFKLYNKQNKLVLLGDMFDTKNRVTSYIKLIKRYARLAKL